MGHLKPSQLTMKIITNKKEALKAVKQNGWALEFASDELKNDREVVLEAVKEKGSAGFALEYASEELKNDRKVVLEAIKEYGGALKYASDELKNDPELRKLAGWDE